MIIGIHGRARSGKDTVADILCRYHGFVRLAFATPIKDMLINGGLCRREDLEGNDKETPLPNIGVTARRLMQTLGTDWGRNMIGADVWIKRADQILQQYLKFTKNVVVTDVRFANEAEYVRRVGGTIWHLQRRLPSNCVALHPSEHALPILPGTDSWIDNDAGLEQLAGTVERALAGNFIVTH
jgi:hypothetical protein